MLEQLNRAINNYQQAWQQLIAKAQNYKFFADQQPTAVAWKSADLAELMNYFTELRDRCDQIHFGWVDERWLITLHLKTEKLAWDIQVIKLMQRRPQSNDPVGLDHLDFCSLSNTSATKILSQEKDLEWSREANNPQCSWISIWFNQTEAKLRTDTVLDPCIAELREAKRKVLEK